MQSKHFKQRRNLLFCGVIGLLVAPKSLATELLLSQTQVRPPLRQSDPAAQAYHYVKIASDAADHPRWNPGEVCANCLLWRGDTRTCAIFVQNTLEPGGWCKSWVALR